MSGLKISEDAQNDLREIWEFVAPNDIRATTRLLKQTTDNFDTLSKFPLARREGDELIIGLRSVAVGSYIIFYQPMEDGVEVLRVLHGSRDVPRAFDEMIG